MQTRIEITCSQEIKEILVKAARDYTAVAFPPDGSDCVLVAREAMLDSIAELEQGYAANGDGRTQYNKRLRAMFKEALRTHYQILETETGRSYAQECQLLLGVVAGSPAQDSDLAAARAADRASAAHA